MMLLGQLQIAWLVYASPAW